MKYKTIILTLFLSAVSIFTSKVYGQEHHEMSKTERNRLDSLDSISKNEAQVQKTKDDDRMADAKSDRKETKAKAKDAQRVERDANTAARESRYAVRSERRAQKSREQANKQANKASKARDKSNSN